MRILIFFKRIINGEVPLRRLIKNGLIVGDNFSRQSGCFIDPTFPFLIEIGDNVTFSKNVCVLSHDASTKRSLGYSKIGLVKIGNNCFVGANVTILPNVTIGDNCVIGAGCVVNRDVPSNSVVFGNPARVLCNTDDYFDKNRLNMVDGNCFDDSCYKQKNLEKQKEIKDKCKYGMCYIK